MIASIVRNHDELQRLVLGWADDPYADGAALQACDESGLTALYDIRTWIAAATSRGIDVPSPSDLAVLRAGVSGFLTPGEQSSDE